MSVDQLLLFRKVPDKLYFKINEVAELAGVPSYVLRFWESEFATIRPKRTDSGQLLYRKNDVETILTIKHLLHEKRFTIEGAKQHLRHEHQSDGAGEGPAVEYMATEYNDEAAAFHSDSGPSDSGPDTAGTPHHEEFIPAEADMGGKGLLKEIYSELQYMHDLLVK